MGAWGGKAFENDSALDWIYELEGQGAEVVRDTLSVVADLGKDEYIEVDSGSAVIAAAEIVAAAMSGDQKEVPTEVAEWLNANARSFAPTDAVLAGRALERVLQKGSEIRELWDENGPDSDWHKAVRGLKARLSAR